MYMSNYYLIGIQYLREYLHLPQEIVPATLKRPVRTETAHPRPIGGLNYAYSFPPPNTHTHTPHMVGVLFFSCMFLYSGTLLIGTSQIGHLTNQDTFCPLCLV